MEVLHICKKERKGKIEGKKKNRLREKGRAVEGMFWHLPGYKKAT